jgi:RNA polymerase sigma-70 factor, ECF subfamily
LAATYSIQRANEATSTDTALASAILSGEVGAERLAWFRFAPTVRRVLRRFVSRFLDEDDLVQEVFLALFHSLPTLRDPAALHGFVIAIAVRTGKYHSRRGWRRWQSEQPVDPDQLCYQLEAVDDVHAQHELRRVARLLQNLRTSDRAAFVLRVVEGMTAKEAANSLGISIATVKRRCSRALAHLKCLAQHDPFLMTYV